MTSFARIGLLLTIIVGGAVLRLWPSIVPYCELDGAVYTRTAQELARAVQTGLIWHQPFDGSHYTAVDYWPPLFPILGALLGSPAAVSAWAGALLAWPVFGLARALFGGPAWRLSGSLAWATPPEGQGGRGAAWWADCSALLAAALVAFHPFLAWLGRTPHSEPLYLLFVAAAAWLALRPDSRRWSWLGAGALLAGAYATRFDALLMLPALGLALGWCRGWRGALWLLAGFGLGALPYLLYLSWLSGGGLALLPPRKVLYDTLEGVCCRVYGWNQFDFCCAYGVPGCFSLADNAANAPSLLSGQVPFLLGEGWRRLPANLLQGQIVWVWLAGPLLLALPYWRERRAQALAWCCLPVLGMALLMSWDVAPRYYAFTLVFLAVLAAKGLELVARVAPPAPNWRWLVAAVALPLGLAAAWTVPGSSHFDQHGPVDVAWTSLLPGAEACRLLLLAAGLGCSALLARRWRGSLAGGLGLLVAAGLAGGPIVAAWEGASSPLESWTALALFALLLLPGALYASLPRERWGWPLWRWTVAAWLLLAGGSLLTLEAWSLAHSRILYSPACVAFLQQQSEAAAQGKAPAPATVLPRGARAGFGTAGPRVLALQQLDSILGEARWLPWPPREAVSAVLERERPDYIVAAFPDPQRWDNRAVVAVPELLATGQTELVASFAVPGGGCLQRWWRVYRLCPSASSD